MKTFFSKLKKAIGNKSDNGVIHKSRPSTLWESMYFSTAQKYEGRGDTEDMALKRLAGICKRNGLPELENIPELGENDFYCGVFNNPNAVLSEQILYNTVFVGMEDTEYIAFLYWTLGKTR